MNQLSCSRRDRKSGNHFFKTVVSLSWSLSLSSESPSIRRLQRIGPPFGICSNFATNCNNSIKWRQLHNFSAILRIRLSSMSFNNTGNISSFQMMTTSEKWGTICRTAIIPVLQWHIPFADTFKSQFVLNLPIFNFRNIYAQFEEEIKSKWFLQKVFLPKNPNYDITPSRVLQWYVWDLYVKKTLVVLYENL